MYKRKQYIIDKKFQLKTTFSIIGIVSIITAFIIGAIATSVVYNNEKIDNIHAIENNIFDLIDEADILGATDAGKKAIGYFYIKDMVCFILEPTQTDFISQYLILTCKKRRFKIHDSFPSVGGFTSVYMNILSNGKIEVVRILRSE